MHKNKEVLSLKMNEEGKIESLGEIIDEAHIPEGAYNGGKLSLLSFMEWWKGRMIPTTRNESKNLWDKVNYEEFVNKTNLAGAFSLSDQYWLKIEGSNISEFDSFFHQDWSYDIGDILFGKDVDNPDFYNPDVTTEGNLKKRWILVDGREYLWKANDYSSEPYNEVIATEIMRRLNIDHVPYSLYTIDNEVGCVCRDFLNPNQDYVAAWKLLRSEKKPNHESWYQFYVRICKERGVNDIVERLDEQILVDYLTCNEDRHFNNFGLIRNAETLEYERAVPVFDTGSSFGFMDTALKMNGYPAKPFKKTQQDQIKLVSDFSPFKLENLEGMDEFIRKLMADYPDQKRVEQMIRLLNIKIKDAKVLAGKL